ncbi:unnamed protein product [Mytilus coruscus]|uniref:Fibronectin type-III domain-containing protein n=1 Tax=Mytilus coruscus TaxID=42192 RepID=A0A6J8BYI1_MYTCO|nr:unnamed protein product [Mytilus coruscus]
MISLNDAYNFTCPSQAHWNIRAKSMCNPPRNYTCLFDVTFRVNIYRERCRRPRILGPGYKYVFQPNLNRATCSVTRYQPFIFDTIGHSDCTYQKSLCNSLGQETYEIGNTTIDRKCICNTDRGYSFVRNSKNQCYCNPLTEDCSCYLGINLYNETFEVKDIKCYDDMKMTRSRYLGDRFNISQKIKIVEFDNYRYNVKNVPTIVVWIIVQRAIRGWNKTRSTPRKLDIVECTDCSITIEWFIDVPDECLSYELHHRPKGTNDWSTGTFLSEEVLEAEDGRRMYTLQNLLPETYYELKMRSVYKDAKSHYSESMTKQTLKQVLPEAINQLSEGDKTRYNKIMQTSKTENRYFVRIMIVGKESAGKTCLLRRLLKENISDVSSTDGVDIVVRRCKINITDGKWIIGKKIDDDKVSRIKRALIPNAEDRDTQNMQEVETNNINISQRDELSSYKKTQQTRCSAVYLVVADMKDEISKQGLSQCSADFQHIGEYIDFWFDSIHCHRTTDKQARDRHFDPPILLVFTGKDKYNKADFEKREKEIKDQMDTVFGLKSKYHHLHNTFYLSNTKDIDEEFEKLQNAVYETARKMDNWGNAFPLKWILLEHLIEINKNDGKNFINFKDMSKLAKHRDINMLTEEDLLLFLRFQHNVGNIIFFENIQDLIILNPQWLADAFRCLVSDRVGNRRLYHLVDWTLFTRQGKISESLITELFEIKEGSQFSGQKNNLHKVMEKLDILVKIENSSYYIMPSQMPSSTFDVVSEKFGILTETCKRTSWLCFKFEFLPPSFFNHLSAWFIRNYNPSKLDSGIALYRGICMFDIEGYGWKKILVTMSTDTIALQVVSFSEQQEGFGNTCSDIYSEVKQLIEDIKVRYKVRISFKLHFKCSDGYYYKDTFEYEELKSDKECYCFQHKKVHRSEQIYSPWMNNEVKRIPNRTEMTTKQDYRYPKIEPNKEEFAPDQTSVKTNLPVSVTLRYQLNIRKSENENPTILSCIKTGNTLVFIDYRNRQLNICNLDGTDIHHIPLSYRPYYMTVINSNTVAVSCTDRTILIINISTGSVTSTINTTGLCYGISYNDNNLYVVIDRSRIHVMDLTGKVIRTIPLPSGDIWDITVGRDRLVCIDTTSIYCCSLDGKLIWKFKKDKFQDLRRVTTDNEGNVYVINNNTNTVEVVSDDGKHHREILTISDGLDVPYGIYFDKQENILLVCNVSDGKAFLFDVKKKLA